MILVSQSPSHRMCILQFQRIVTPCRRDKWTGRIGQRQENSRYVVRRMLTVPIQYEPDYSLSTE